MSSPTPDGPAGDGGLRLTALRKTLGGRSIIDDLDLTVQRGEREGDAEEHPQRTGTGVARGLLEAAGHGAERGRGEPGHEDERAEQLDDDDAEERVHQAQRVEDPCHRQE